MKLTCAGTKKIANLLYPKKLSAQEIKPQQKLLNAQVILKKSKRDVEIKILLNGQKEYAKNLLSQKKKLRRAYFLSCLLRCLLTKMSVTHAMQAIFSCRIFIIHLDLIRYAPLFQKINSNYDLMTFFQCYFTQESLLPAPIYLLQKVPKDFLSSLNANYIRCTGLLRLLQMKTTSSSPNFTKVPRM